MKVEVEKHEPQIETLMFKADPARGKWNWFPSSTKLYAVIGVIVINSCLIAWMLQPHGISMPPLVDLGVVESGVVILHTIEITNSSSTPITCLGATEACGYGCYKSSSLPARIEPGESINVVIEYKPPFPETLARLNIPSQDIKDDMMFYFDDARERNRILQIHCRLSRRGHPK